MEISKSAVMSRAWEIARNQKQVKNGERTAQSLLWRGLEFAWAEAKESLAKYEVSQKSQSKTKTGKYLELATVARDNGLNHGKTWYCTGYMVDSKSLSPAWEGEEICYIYAN